MFDRRTGEDRAANGRVHDDRDGDDTAAARIRPLRAAAAQVLLSTAAAAALERGEESSESFRLTPLVIAPLAVAAGLLHARSPAASTTGMLRLLNGTAVLVGGGLLVSELLSRRGRRRRFGALGFAAAGVLGLVLERYELAADRAERRLRQRAAIVERLVPRRAARLDRIVVHV